MTTKDYCFLSKDRQNIFVTNISNNEYSNFNLNPNHPNFSLDTVLSNNVGNNERRLGKYDLTDKNYFQNTKNSWSKKNLLSNYLNNEINGHKKKELKGKASNPTSKNSTLSIHISAYENFIEATDIFNDKNNEDLKNKKSGFLIAPALNIQNPFEFPRQQTANQVSDPEIMQYKANQQLLNPSPSTASIHSQAMPSSTPSSFTPSTQPIISRMTRKRMYPKISKDNNDQALVSIGEMVRQRWLIKGMIGSGGYGQIYYSLDTRQNDHVAVKVEPTKRNGKTVRRMILEQKVLLRLQGRAHVALMYGSGVEHDLNYIVLQLLSVNLGDLRKQCPLKRFSKSTAGRIMQQAIAGIRDIHQIGYLHRDIKPANMCFGLSEASKHRLVIVDFGLVRKYVNADGRVRPSRYRAGFRGTLRYVSLRVHDRMEQGPADDLIALLYSLIEMVHGELGWRKMGDSTEIRAAKEELVKDDFRTVSCKFGNSFREYARAVSKMTASEEPNYRVLQEMMRDFSGNKSISAEYDWENEYAEVIAEVEINRHLKIIQ